MKIISVILSLIICLSCFIIPVYAENRGNEMAATISSEDIVSYNADGTLTVETDDGIQYVVFMVTNIHYNKLESYVSEMVNLHGEIDSTSDRMYAFGVEHVLNAYPTSGHGLNEDLENMALAEQLLNEYIVKYLDSVDK